MARFSLFVEHVGTPRPVRLSTFDYTGASRYFLTMCCKDRQEYFREPEVVRAATLELLRTSERRQFAVIAYTFMPDHFHGLVEGLCQEANLRTFVSLLRRRTTIATKFTCPVGLWQDGYHERVLRQTEDTQKVVDYILNNPVRAGLVDCAAAYPFSLRPRPSYVPISVELLRTGAIV